MNKKVVICKKTGKGSHDDPIRPHLSSIPEIAKLHKILDALRQKGIEIQNQTFYIMQIKRDLGDEVEVEIIEPEKSIKERISELSKMLLR